MPYGELTLGPERKPINHNPANGQFVKGHTPHNKYKTWDQFASEESQAKMRKGWKNLETHRPTTRPDTAGRCRKEVVAIHPDGTVQKFAYVGEAAIALGISRDNIARCCRFNQERHINRKTGKVNTDHTYMGIRFYFREDLIWIDKKYAV